MLQGDRPEIPGGVGLGQMTLGIAQFPRDSMAFLLILLTDLIIVFVIYVVDLW